MKALIVAPFSSFTDSIHSHNSASAEIMRDLLRRSYPELRTIDILYSSQKKFTDIESYDLLYAYYGVNHQRNSGINFWGGLKEQNFEIEKRIFDFHGEIIPIIDPFPKSYVESFKGRLESNEYAALSESKKQEIRSIDLERMSALSEIEPIKCFHSNKVIIGDSHSISLYRPGWYPYYNYGKTLNGALKRGLNQYVNDITHPENLTHIEFYFGNIDIRFHVCRLYDGYYHRNVKELVDEYVKQVEAIPIPNKAIYELLPIENESRKMAKVTMYKGKPFFGSWRERNEARLWFKELLKERTKGTGIEVVEWVDYLMNDKGELDFKCMERPKSIHLSRASYPYWQGTSTINSLFI